MVMLDHIVLLISAYLTGSISSAVWIGKIFYNKDVREHGSGNAGGSGTSSVGGGGGGDNTVGSNAQHIGGGNFRAGNGGNGTGSSITGSSVTPFSLRSFFSGHVQFLTFQSW